MCRGAHRVHVGRLPARAKTPQPAGPWLSRSKVQTWPSSRNQKTFPRSHGSVGCASKNVRKLRARCRDFSFRFEKLEKVGGVLASSSNPAKLSVAASAVTRTPVLHPHLETSSALGALVASVYSGLLWTQQRANTMGGNEEMRDTAAEWCGRENGVHARRCMGKEKRPRGGRR
jgi:hypothetical protein